VIIDDTRLVAKNLLEINIKSIFSEITQFEEILKSREKNVYKVIPLQNWSETKFLAIIPKTWFLF